MLVYIAQRQQEKGHATPKPLAKADSLHLAVTLSQGMYISYATIKPTTSTQLNFFTTL